MSKTQFEVTLIWKKWTYHQSNYDWSSIENFKCIELIYLILTEDLVETWHIRDSLEDNFLSLLIVDPQLLLEHLDTANVSVRSEQNMLKLGLLLIDVFYSIWCFITRAIDTFIFLLRRSSLHCLKMFECKLFKFWNLNIC